MLLNLFHLHMTLENYTRTLNDIWQKNKRKNKIEEHDFQFHFVFPLIQFWQIWEINRELVPWTFSKLWYQFLVILLLWILIIPKGRTPSGSYKQSMKPRACFPNKPELDPTSVLWPYIATDTCNKQNLHDDLHFVLGMCYLIPGCNYRETWSVVKKCFLN